MAIRSLAGLATLIAVKTRKRSRILAFSANKKADSPLPVTEKREQPLLEYGKCPNLFQSQGGKIDQGLAAPWDRSVARMTSPDR
jgi:hypothetical protein